MIDDVDSHDAARWRAIKRTFSVRDAKMGGDHSWKCNESDLPRGCSMDEVADRLIALYEQRCREFYDQQCAASEELLREGGEL